MRVPSYICDAQVAGAGEECLQLLRENMQHCPANEQFNLVLCDVMMEGLDGIQVLEQIRLECAAFTPAPAHLPPPLHPTRRTYLAYAGTATGSR